MCGQLGHHDACLQDASEPPSTGASQSLTASFLHDSVASTCSAPSFKFNVHAAPVEVSARESEGAPGSLLTHAYTIDSRASSPQSFHFPDGPHVQDIGYAGPPGTLPDADKFPAFLGLQQAPSGDRGYRTHSTFPAHGMGVARHHQSVGVQQDMLPSAASALAAPPFAALTPCAHGPAPMRLETVDEHTPSPMHPLHARRLQLPPGCLGKACPGAAAGMMHLLHGMHGEPSPDITWSPLRPRGVNLPSPNYCSPAALGAMHGHAMPGHAMHAYGHTQLPMLEAARSHSAGGKVAAAPVPHSPPACEDPDGHGCEGGAAAADRRCGGLGRRPWLCLTTPRTSSADGEGLGDGCASEAVGEAGGSWLEGERGSRVATWRRRREDAGTAPASMPEDSARELSLPYNGSTVHAPLQGNGADISTSVAGAGPLKLLHQRLGPWQWFLANDCAGCCWCCGSW